MRLRLAHRYSYAFGPLKADEFAFGYHKEDGGLPARIYFHCRGQPTRPDGTLHPRICAIPISVDGPDKRPTDWLWDGNWGEPTITPSIDCDKRCGWHGFLTKGEIAP